MQIREMVYSLMVRIIMIAVAMIPFDSIGDSSSILLHVIGCSFCSSIPISYTNDMGGLRVGDNEEEGCFQQFALISVGESAK